MTEDSYEEKAGVTNQPKVDTDANPDLLHGELAFLAEKNDGKKKTKRDYQKDQETAAFLVRKKNEMKNSPHRKRFDRLYAEIRDSLVNTEEQNPSANANNGSKQWTPMMTYINGGANYRPIYKLEDNSTSVSSLPKSNEPYTFSKILVAAALFGARIPDAIFKAQDVVYAMTMYKLWADSWKDIQGNGENCLESFVQNNFTYGWAAKRTYPRRVQQMIKGVPRIRFDGIYRQTLKPNRTWLGVGHSNSDYWSQIEYAYEEDCPLDTFKTLFPDACTGANKKKLEYAGVDSEQGAQNAQSVVIFHYENELTNRYIKACGSYIIYDGELLSDDGELTVQVANCYVRDCEDPYGVGLWELARSNDRVANHLRGLNLEQVEAEVAPILFGAVNGPGDNTYKRGSGVINPKQQGTSIDVVRTTGNVAQGMGVVKSERNSLDAITGINDIVAGLGSETTLGATVLAKEAAQQRLVLPRNSIIRALEKDAYVTVSFINQIYPKPYIFIPKNEEDKVRFVRLNQSYFVEDQTVEGQNIVVASLKLAINFDYNMEAVSEEEIDETGLPTEDKKSDIVVSRMDLFEELRRIKAKYNLSRVLDITIDPNSMLQPSTEITKQNIITLFPLIQQAVTQIYQTAQTDPELAEAMYQQVSRLLETNRENVYDWFPRSFVDQMISGSMMDPEMKALAQANRMAALQEQMAATGMPQDATMPTGEAAAQNPMGAAMNASTGRASQVDEGQAV